MAILVALLGESGSGKSTTFRNADPDSTYYINADKKALPFKYAEKFNTDRKNYLVSSDIIYISDKIIPALNDKKHIKTCILDTANALMIDREMSVNFRNRKSGGEALNKWMDLAVEVYDLIQDFNALRDDLIVYILGHTCTDDDGIKRLVTNGRKLEKIKLESKIPIVFHTNVKYGANGTNEYMLETQTNYSTAKSPMGMFSEFLIPNDVTFINERIREYYGTN